MTTPDPLLERLRQLPRPALDDVASARTLARAEAAFAAAPPARAARAAGSRLGRWSVPAALALWGIIYCGGAVREIGRLFPAGAAPAVAARHRGPTDFDPGAQFMLNATSKTSARTTTTTTITVPLLDPLLATSPSRGVPVWLEVSSDMDPSMQVVACDTQR